MPGHGSGIGAAADDGGLGIVTGILPVDAYHGLNHLAVFVHVHRMLIGGAPAGDAVGGAGGGNGRFHRRPVEGHGTADVQGQDDFIAFRAQDTGVQSQLAALDILRPQPIFTPFKSEPM